MRHKGARASAAALLLALAVVAPATAAPATAAPAIAAPAAPAPATPAPATAASANPAPATPAPATAASATDRYSSDRPANVRIHNFGAISENYYRGAQPKGRDYADLAALGVRTVIDLTRHGDSKEPRLVESAGMKFYRIPLTTDDRPPEEAVKEFLEIVTNRANLPVYVHCQGGRHRTGVMTAVYRITQDGWTADRAYDEMRRYDFEGGIVAHTALKNFVFDYYTQYARVRPSEHEVAAGAAK